MIKKWALIGGMVQSVLFAGMYEKPAFILYHHEAVDIQGERPASFQEMCLQKLLINGAALTAGKIIPLPYSTTITLAALVQSRHVVPALPNAPASAGILSLGYLIPASRPFETCSQAHTMINMQACRIERDKEQARSGLDTAFSLVGIKGKRNIPVEVGWKELNVYNTLSRAQRLLSCFPQNSAKEFLGTQYHVFINGVYVPFQQKMNDPATQVSVPYYPGVKGLEKGVVMVEFKQALEGKAVKTAIYALDDNREQLSLERVSPALGGDFIANFSCGATLLSDIPFKLEKKPSA